jgi:uncharacterized protein (TIGR02284 family)
MAEIEREHIDNSHVISVLENLIEANRNAQDGYRDAAEHIHDAQLRAFFNEQRPERAHFAGELENEVIRHGKRDPERSGTVGGVIHRSWIDLKVAIGAGDHAILSSIESGEDHAQKVYEDAINDKLPEDLKGILRQHAQAVFTAHDHVRMLRDRSKAA